MRAGETFALVIADPPWVTSREVGQFPEDPLTAIDGGSDGLEVARACLRVIREHLAPGGSAVLQLGNTDQAGLLADEEMPLGGALTVADVRRHERGVLVRIDRDPPGAA